ncbi:MAG: tRNA (adenosine(37)-N6)-threonylcarbamoyltransferase complex ATPase subunit type 1 TsaE, partial [Magnetospirillum sp.]|nr:tRNA (adenosine(37)-N6)-threonylcarbamoyltransferase complex ATPase subunit type 1 TsaE [Magnetospirillum sp.]
MESMIVHLADEAATAALGHQLASLARPGDVIALHGTLGMGKSTLARAFIRALTSQDEDVPSPTFTLVQMYEGANGDLWHFDLYRLDKPEDAFELGIEDAFVDGVSLIEWPDRLGRLMPRQRLEIHLHPGHK